MIDDYVRNPPTTVDIEKMLGRNPKHKNCDLIVKQSKKAKWYFGLYCKKHDHWIQWVNDYQIDYLRKLGVEIDKFEI
jgi:hypothetical protein